MESFETWASNHGIRPGSPDGLVAEKAWNASAARFINDWDDGYYHGTLDGANRCISKLQEYIKTVEEE